MGRWHSAGARHSLTIDTSRSPLKNASANRLVLQFIYEILNLPGK